MGHDRHFLERLDRLTAEQVDLALSLYRDPRLVRYLVDRAALRLDEARLAISLGDAQQGPYLVLSRDGHFVTCLAAGMSPVGLSIRTRAWLDEAAEAHEELRAGLVRARQSTGVRSDVVALLKGIKGRAERLPREDYRALAALVPVIGPVTWDLVANEVNAAQDIHPRLARLRGARKKTDQEAVTAYWRSIVGASTAVLMLTELVEHLLEVFLALMAKKGGKLTVGLVDFGVAGITYRAAHFAASLGEPAIDFYERELVTATTYLDVIDAFGALNALAARRGEFAKRVRGTFARLRESPPPGPLASMYSQVADALLQKSLDEQVAITLEPFLEPHESLPPEHARTCALNGLWSSLDADDGLVRALYGCALAGRASAEDFFHPQAVLREISARRSPEEHLEVARRRGSFPGLTPAVETARTGPARSAPCTCGSGKKYKRCCG